MEEIQSTTGRKKDRDGLYKRRDYWHYELSIDGKKRSFSTGSKDYNQAKKVRAKAVKELQEGRLPSDSGRRRLEAVAAEYIKHRESTVSAGTVRLEKERLRALNKVLGNVMLKDISNRAIRSYQAARAEVVSNRTVNLETKLLRGILVHQGQWTRLAADYKRLKEQGSTVGRALSPGESLRLFTMAESNPDWMTAFCAAVVANDTGMRGIELKSLRLQDVNIEGRQISIRRSKNESGIRSVVLTNDALKAMLKLLERAEALDATKPEHFLFPYKIRKGTGYDPTQHQRSWRGSWRKLTQAAGLPGFRFHDLRHTFVTSHAEMGTPLPVVMAQAGHLSRKMSELYTHISQRSMQDAASKFERRKAEQMAEAKEKQKASNEAADSVRRGVN